MNSIKCLQRYYFTSITSFSFSTGVGCSSLPPSLQSSSIFPSQHQQHQHLQNISPILPNVDTLNLDNSSAISNSMIPPQNYFLFDPCFSFADSSNPSTSEGPKIVVIGVGGAGGNVVNNMIAQKLQGVDFISANTDYQALSSSLAKTKIQLGESITQGLGAGAIPEVGRKAAEEDIDNITSHLKGTNLCFLTAGQGGGTGTGAAPVIAKACKELGILTVGVVTKPFRFEGPKRMQTAEQGIKELFQYVDTLLIIPNQQLMRISKVDTSFKKAFQLADQVLYESIKGISDLVILPGLINLDFSDLSTILSDAGICLMGSGEATGEDRARKATERALNNPLLGDISIANAKGVLLSITGGADLGLNEVDEIATSIRNQIHDNHDNVNIIFGTTYDENLTDSIRVSVIVTHVDASEIDDSKLGRASSSMPSKQQPISSFTRQQTKPGVYNLQSPESAIPDRRSQGSFNNFQTEKKAESNSQTSKKGFFARLFENW